MAFILILFHFFHLRFHTLCFSEQEKFGHRILVDLVFCRFRINFTFSAEFWNPICQEKKVYAIAGVLCGYFSDLIRRLHKLHSWKKVELINEIFRDAEKLAPEIMPSVVNPLPPQPLHNFVKYLGENHGSSFSLFRSDGSSSKYETHWISFLT